MPWPYLPHHLECHAGGFRLLGKPRHITWNSFFLSLSLKLIFVQTWSVVTAKKPHYLTRYIYTNTITPDWTIYGQTGIWDHHLKLYVRFDVWMLSLNLMKIWFEQNVLTDWIGNLQIHMVGCISKYSNYLYTIILLT